MVGLLPPDRTPAPRGPTSAGRPAPGRYVAVRALKARRGPTPIDRDVTIASPTIIQQALDLGLVDEIAVSLVPVRFGTGRTYFGDLANAHVMLDDPEVVQGRRAVHLRFPVRRRR